jgi:ribonuclease D
MTSGIHNLLPTEPIWVTDDAQLQKLCQRWMNQPVIAVDTEFVRTNTFYPIAALFQVGDGTGCYLIDPLSIKDFSCFNAVLINPNVTKVMHSCSEDMEVFGRFLEVIPTPIFDTQIAAALAGYDFSMGYARLIEKLIGISLAKDETRSDWLQRPLSEPQLRYAALDVAYLLVVYGMLQKRLSDLDRTEWALQDCADIVSAASKELDPDEYYLKIKLAWKLNRQQLACLQLIAAWREGEARDQNMPRNRLIKEHALLDIARSGPTEIKQLQKFEGVSHRVVKSYGDELLDIVQQAYHLPMEICPPLMDKPLAPEAGLLVKKLKQALIRKAEELEVPVEVLLRKKDIEFMVRGFIDRHEMTFPERLKGWRKEILSDHLQETLFGNPEI